MNYSIKDIYKIIGDTREKLRSSLGIEVSILDLTDNIIIVKVEQKELINGYILTQSELVSKSGELFDKLNGYTIYFKPMVYFIDYDNINGIWLKDRMKELKIKPNDIVRQLAITKEELKKILSNEVKLTYRTKATFYFYFLTYQLNRDFRN